MLDEKNKKVIFWGCAAIEAIALIVVLVNTIREPASLIFMLLFAQVFVIPAILTFVNIYLLFIKPKDERSWKIKSRHFEIILVLVGFLFSAIVLALFVRFADWDMQLAFGESHSPVWTGSIPTVVTLFLIGIIGYFVLAFTHIKRTPPLVTVLAVSALYIGVFECIVWSIQVFSGQVLLIILPVNCIIIAIRLIREKACELRAYDHFEEYKKGGLTGFLAKEFLKERLPLWALLFAFPLLGVIIVILVLFGQRPDDIIRGYTETAGWTLSKHIAPPGYDNHYLCTVAAQGHEKLVRPQRVGIRHGRKIIVNRQLCIANAFEQVLEERTPNMHKAVRGFYDAHGFPLSKTIKTKVAADVIFIAMKPLEWIFLAVLYLFTVNPEERILRQYR